MQLTARRLKALRPGAGGFTLVEVLVALIVLSVGLMGIAKMEGLAIASTAVATRRSLAAIEAASLGDSMHVDKAYWNTASAADITISGNQVTQGLPVSPAPTCVQGSPCNAPDLAAYDLNQWAISLHSLLPDDTATVTCNTSTPIQCLITISWSEQAVAINSAQAADAAGSAITNNAYTLYVEP